LGKRIAESLIQKGYDEKDEQIISEFADDSSRENMIQSYTLRLMSLPEFQLI
jgi:hypothetical protein